MNSEGAAGCINLKFNGRYAPHLCPETKAGDCRNQPPECQGNCCSAARIIILIASAKKENQKKTIVHGLELRGVVCSADCRRGGRVRFQARRADRMRPVAA